MAMFENSRYLHTRPYTRLGWDNQTLQMRERYTFDQDKATLHEWCDGDTLDGVAHKYLGNCALRWAILDMNPKYRTEFDIAHGDMVMIPDYDEVVSLINV